MRAPALLLLGALLAAAAVAADDPRALAANHPAIGPALAYRSLTSEIAERNLHAATIALQQTGAGVSGSLSYRPRISWRGREWEDFDLADPTFEQVVTLSAAWRFDPQAIARAAIAELSAHVSLSQGSNRDLREALAWHIELQRAHIALTLAQEAAVARDRTLADAEAVDLGQLSEDPTAQEPSTLLAARLEAERAAAAVARAARDLGAAERQALRAGFDPQAAADSHRDRFALLPLEGWRLLLPAGDPLTTPEVRRAALELELAEATAGRIRFAGLLPDLRLEVSRTLEAGRAGASWRLDEGRPSVGLDLSVQSAARPSWSVVVSAVVRIGESSVRDLERGQLAVEDAARALADALDRSEWTLERARRTAIDAEEDVAFSERGLALARANLRDAVARWSASDRSDERERERADAALVRFALALERERDAFYRAWNRYLLEAERAWNAAGVLGGVLVPAP